MYIHRDAKLIFLAHPRTASNSTVNVLRRSGFEEIGPHHGKLWDIEKNYSEELAGTFIKETRDEWTTFTTVRNHWDVVVSWVFRKFRPGDTRLETLSFKIPEYKWNIETAKTVLDRTHWVKEDRIWWLHTNDSDVILRYENLQEDLNHLLIGHGFDPLELPWQNVTRVRSGRPYQEFYDEELKEYIYNRFKAEINELNYTFEEHS